MRACSRRSDPAFEVGPDPADDPDPSFAAGFQDRLSQQMNRGQFRCEGRHRTKDGRVIAVDINTSATELLASVHFE